MPTPILVPVVVHRIYGHALRAVPARRQASPRGGNRFTPDLQFGTGFEIVRVVEASHGTRRSIEDIRRLFHDGGSPAGIPDWSVNHLWRQARVQFLLAGIVDQTIDSHLADFVPNNAVLHPDVSHLRYENAINVFFVRQLEGARGWVSGRDIFMGDRWDLTDSMPPDGAWRGDVITLSHEIGHILDLSHRGDRDNLMFGHGTLESSADLTAAQAVFAQQRARAYRRPWYRGLPDDDELGAAEVVVPHVLGYTGARLPTFD